MRKKLVIVADDFTGANDTGIHFRKVGMKVKVIINIGSIKDEMAHSDVLVVDIESRMDAMKEAYRKSCIVGEQLKSFPDLVVYKKLDSTFRGNIGSEIDGLMDAMNLPVLFLAPAWPSNGRTTEKGDVYVHGIRLTETEASRDPRTPVGSSRISDILAMQSKRSTLEISSEMYKNKVEVILAFIMEKIEHGVDIFIFDCVEERDLATVACLIETFKGHRFLIAGSSGLAGYLSMAPFLQRQKLSFAFAGSVSERSGAQINYTLKEGGCELIFLDGESLMNNSYDEQAIIASINKGIQNGFSRFIFTASLKRKDVQKVFDAAKKKSLSHDQASEKLAASFGDVAAKMILHFQPSGVLLTGGETAINTVIALNATGFNIQQEIVPGVQCGELTGSSVAAIIATKAGAFGDIDAISKTFEFFKV